MAATDVFSGIAEFIHAGNGSIDHTSHDITSSSGLTSNCGLTPSLDFNSSREFSSNGNEISRPLFGLESRVAYFLIGLLLATTAVLKLWMLLTDSFADVRIGISKEILWMTLAFEFWLAYENFRLREARVMALVNAVVFASFGVFATARWLAGYGSCGCSGKLELPAWLFILIDAAIVAWFLRNHAARIDLREGYRQLRQYWQSLTSGQRGRWTGFAITAGLLVSFFQLPIGAPMRAFILEDDLIIAVVEIDGELILNQESAGQVEIINHSHQPAKIIGLSRSCRCFDLADDPNSKIIPASGRFVLPLVIKPNKLGPLHQRVELFLDHPKQFRLNVNVVSSVSGVK